MPRSHPEPRRSPPRRQAEGTRRPRADAQRNRLRILAAAVRRFSHHGLDVPLEEIAAEAGVGIATVYRHFPSRQDLVVAVVEQCLGSIARRAADTVRSGEEPMLALRSLLAYGAEQHTANRVLLELWRTVDHEVVMEAVRSTGLYESTGQLLDDARAVGAVHDDLTVEDIARIFSAIAGVIESGNGDAWRRVLELHLRGMAAPGPALPELVGGYHPFVGRTGGSPPYTFCVPVTAHAPFSTRTERDHMSAILFGSISTIADTSEAQRQAFNAAFEAHGLSWHWDRDTYRAMLERNGGHDRITDYASSMGQEVDAAAIHRTKSEIFQRILSEAPPTPRPGVVETVRQAKSSGVKVALVTSTSEANITSLLGALGPDLQRSDFELVVDSTKVDEPKPDRAAYVYALDQLSEAPSDCVAIEDNLGGVLSATAAGLRCIAFPNQNTAGHHFEGAQRLVDAVEFDDLHQLIASP